MRVQPQWAGESRLGEGMVLDNTIQAPAIPPDGLTLKERFRRTMSFQDVDLRPNFEFGYWDTTLTEWHKQGLPADVHDEASAYDYFGIENWHVLNVNSVPLPLHQYVAMSEDNDHLLIRDEWGVIAEVNTFGPQTIPHYIDFPVKDAASWEPFEAALDPEAPQRWKDFEASVEIAKRSTRPIGVYAGSLVGTARNIMGFERMATLPYEDPALFERIVSAFGRCAVAVLERALPHAEVDFGLGWEDMCFNQGPLIPPDVFRKVVGPWIRRIADTLAAHGCHVYATDTDGNINPIVDVFLDNGLNTMFPVEVHAGSDPCALRDRYSSRIKLWGGVDKRKLMDTKQTIDEELERLRPYVEDGGFIPTVDHRVPDDVPLSNYLYYLDRKREVLHVGGDPKY